MHRRPHLHHAVLVAALLLMGSLLPPSAAAGGGLTAPRGQVSGDNNLEHTQTSLRQQQADLAAELDVLQASAEQVAAALEALDRNVALQQAHTQAATLLAEEANQREIQATASVEAKQVEVERLAQRVQEMAIGLYLRPPFDDAVHALINTTPGENPTALALVRFRVEDVAETLQATERARDALAAAQVAATQARRRADQALSAQQAELATLQAVRDQQQGFAIQVSDRIERALGEAAQLADLDAELSSQMQQRELELANRLRDSLAKAGTTVVVINADPIPGPAGSATPTDPTDPTATTATAPPATAAPGDSGGPGGPGDGADGQQPPATAATTAPTTTSPPTAATTAPRVIVITPVDTTWVRGIEVAAQIAPQFEALMAAAEAGGLKLAGSGYRNTARQIEIRREVCGPTDYDIYLKPSWECSPPVARPGTSMHEKGLAIDFTDGEDLVRREDHPVHQWLANYAKTHPFLRNLKGEPWHWSTTGG